MLNKLKPSKSIFSKHKIPRINRRGKFDHRKPYTSKVMIATDPWWSFFLGKFLLQHIIQVFTLLQFLFFSIHVLSLHIPGHDSLEFMTFIFCNSDKYKSKLTKNSKKKKIGKIKTEKKLIDEKIKPWFMKRRYMAYINPMVHFSLIFCIDQSCLQWKYYQ